LLATNLPLFPGRIQLPIALRVDLLLPLSVDKTPSDSSKANSAAMKYQRALAGSTQGHHHSASPGNLS
jgi:hypothetical protein